MAYNSDGYIMLDFTEVDFRRTNQTIEGLFDRCQKVIGTNKFVIVINANNKTPLPSTVCITNGQYVIESVLYTFAISSNDNLHITKKTTPEELIDDDHVTLKTTFSSNKIMSLLAGLIKTHKYIGAGGPAPHSITFPDTPSIIFTIQGDVNTSSNSPWSISNIIIWGLSKSTTYSAVRTDADVSMNLNSIPIEFSGNSLILNGSNATHNFNTANIEYTVYYI